jgi:hypothetical protein
MSADKLHKVALVLTSAAAVIVLLLDLLVWRPF